MTLRRTAVFSRGIVCFFAMLVSSNVEAKDYPVANTAEFNKAVTQVKPGDQIIMSEGRWANVKLQLKANGAKDQLIKLKAAII